MDSWYDVLQKNELVFAFLITGIILFIASIMAVRLFSNKIPAAAIGIMIGLALAYIGGVIQHGTKGLGDISLFSGMNVLGGPMFRDLAIVATALGASMVTIKKAGVLGLVSLGIGICIAFFCGAFIAWLSGYRDAVSICTIGAGACTYIVGPVTGTALGASSELIALSIGTGVIKAIVVAIGTPLVAKFIGLDNPRSAMVFGGIMGTNAGVMAGLAATDPKLVPYGAITATFYTGLGCLVCPSLFYFILRFIVP
jgi:malonate transporter MadM subunit